MLKISNITRITLVALLTLVSVSSSEKLWASEAADGSGVDTISSPTNPPILNDDGASDGADSSMIAPINESYDDSGDY